MSIINADKEDKYAHTHFETVDDLLEFDVPQMFERNWAYEYNSDKGVSWYGIGNSAKETIECIRTGWPEGLKLAQEALQLIEIPKVRSSKRRRVQRDFGDHFDIQRMYSGQLDRAWQSTEKDRSVNIGSHNAIIIVELSTSASIDAPDAFWRGAAAVMIADMLQSAGRNVKIIGMNTVRRLFERSKLLSCTSVVLKDYEQPLDLDLVIAATSAGMNRTLMFKSKMYRTEFGAIRSSLGMPMTGFLPEYLDDGSNIIRVEGVWSQAEAERKLKQVATDYNATS